MNHTKSLLEKYTTIVGEIDFRRMMPEYVASCGTVANLSRNKQKIFEVFIYIAPEIM